jgi:hypothetical protein
MLNPARFERNAHGPLRLCRLVRLAQPVRIEIPIGFAIVGKARHVPMADQMRIGIPNWRPACPLYVASVRQMIISAGWGEKR